MNAQYLRGWRVLPALVVVLSLLASGIAMAGTPEAGPLGPAAPRGTEDGGVEVLDVGAEFSSADAPPWGAGGSDLPYTNASAWHFYNAMRSAGYTGPHSFVWGNNNAWESDWTRAPVEGGSENSWIDNVDIMFFHNHGGSGGMWFPWGSNADRP